MAWFGRKDRSYALGRPTAAFPISPVEVFREDVRNIDPDVTDDVFDKLAASLEEVTYVKDEVIFDNGTREDHFLFVSHGVCSGQFGRPDGQVVIARFFKSGDFCASTPLTLRDNVAHNAVTAATKVSGVVIPMGPWMDDRIEDRPLSRYLRRKLTMTHIFDINVLAIKTVNRTAESIKFLEQHQPEILGQVSQKKIAQFVGITPEALSRFLRSKA